MARKVEAIYSATTNNLKNSLQSIGVNINPDTWSRTNMLRLICYTIAVAISYHEQLWDIHYEKIKAVQSASAAGSAIWLQTKAFEFQYSATTPQYVTVQNGIPAYAVINENLKIVTACSVQPTTSSVVNIKVAKNSPLEKLSSAEKSALQDYINTIGTAGIYYNVISKDSDKLYIKGKIYYKGAYSATIQTIVVNAINDYLSNLSKERFGGDILLSDIKRMIRSIEGVNDIEIERISCRTNSQSIFGGIDLVTNSDEINRKYIMDSGYLVAETTTGNTLNDTLTYIPE